MKKLFKNSEIQERFERDGYIKMDLLQAEEVEQLKSYYFGKHFDNKIEEGFHVSLDNLDSQLVDEVGQKIRSILTPKTLEIFENPKVFTASFVIKEPGLRNIVPPHQDWTFVDENEFTSVTLWTPLVGVTEENGALGVIPGSHRLFNYPRSSPSPQSKSPLADHIFTLFPYVEIIDMKAGETLIFNNRLIHASPPNLSKSARLAVGIGVTQADASLIHYYHVPNSTPPQLARYEVEESFYLWYNNARLSDFFNQGAMPEELRYSEIVERKVPDLSVEEMKQLVESLPDTAINQPLMNKLKKLFEDDPQVKKAQAKVTSAPTEEVPDGRSFFQKYTPANIVREILWRMGGRKQGT